MKNWYSIQNKDSGVLYISLHDEIGLWGISAKDFIADLRKHDGVKVINLSIHSPGGSVLDGLAMYNALKSHKATIHGSVEGVAASAASFVLMASDTISMPEDAFLMIHNAWGGVIGDAEEMRAAANVVDKLQDSIVNIYQKRSGMDESGIREMMSEETWLNASDALESGFIDTITGSIGVAAKISGFDKHFKNMPITNDLQIEEIKDKRDFERCLRDVGGVSNRLAKALTSRAGEIFQRDVEDQPTQDFSQIEAALKRLEARIS